MTQELLVPHECHPGWKANGTIIRSNGDRFILLDDGKYDQINETWVFTAQADNLVEPWLIIPDLRDTYIASTIPLFKETQMLTRNWIVVSSTNEPSPNPTKHTSEQTAIEEAKRLALKNPSDTFFVYELKRAFKVETVKEIEVSDIPF